MTQTLAHKALPVGIPVTLDTSRAVEGIITAIVGITNVVDHVNDEIVPGAFTRSLEAMRPKVAWQHDLNRLVGRVLHAEEWMPGDPRFADVPGWPAKAGALVATMQFNLAVADGAMAFGSVQFYAETGEAEFSIGYVVPAGAGRTRPSDGARLIHEIVVFEVSSVPFGAAPHTRVLSIKSLPVDDDAAVGFDLGLAAGGYDPLAEIASDVEPKPDVEPEPDAEPEDDAEDDAEDDGVPPTRAEAALHSAARAADPDYGLVLEPLGTLDTKGGVPGVADTPSDRAGVRRLVRWYERGEGAAKIAWGTPGDFTRCVKIAGKHMTPEQAKGFCNKRHVGAVGAPPGQGHPGKKAAVEVEIPGGYDPLLEAAHAAGGSRAEGKALFDVEVSGSVEARLQAVRTAVGIEHPYPSDVYAEERVSTRPLRWRLAATFDDRVLLARNVYDSGLVEYALQGYHWTGSGTAVLFGEPEPVSVDVSITAALGIAPEEPVDLDRDEFDSALAGVTGARAEVKAGRVLSGANAASLRAAVEHLVSVLRAAGVVIDTGQGTGEANALAGARPDSTASMAPEGAQAKSAAEEFAALRARAAAL